MLVDHAPLGRIGFFASWQSAGQAGELLLGALAAATAAAALSPARLAD